MKNLKSFFLIFSILTLYQTKLSAEKGELNCLLFSEKKSLSPGFFWLGLELISNKDKISFVTQELIYHPKKGWEEWIYTGEVKKEENQYWLLPKDCQVRANRQFGEKKGMVRRFDCEHLRIKLSNEKDQWALDQDLSGSGGALAFPIEIPDSGKPRALVIDLPEGGEGIWGFHLNGIQSATPDFQWDPNKKSWDRIGAKTKESQTKPGPIVYQWKRAFSN